MDKNYKNETSLFPENTPLAMCYVPFQKYDETYPENIALEKGTVFPELYFPFLGDGGDCKTGTILVCGRGIALLSSFR